MRHLLKRMTVFTALLTSALILTPVLAAARPHHGGGHGPGHRMNLEQLDLDDDQRDALRELSESYRESLSSRFSDLREAREALDEAIRAGELDEDKLRLGVDRVAAAELETALLRARMNGEMRNILTPEQAAQLDAERAERRERHGERRMERRQRFEERRDRPGDE